MNTITRMMLSVTMAAMAAVCMADTKTTYRDAQGRVQGTVSTDRYGTTTYRDSMGRLQGTATTDSSGKVTYRDSMGRLQGTVTTDSSGKKTCRTIKTTMMMPKKLVTKYI